MRARGDGRATFEWLVLPVLLGVACATLYWIAASDVRWHDALDYRRMAIANGQWWRLFTAHLMHVNAAHEVLDVAGLLLVAWIFARELDGRRQALALLIGAASVDVGLWFFHPDVERYVGLSGALHALFAAGATGWLLAKSGFHLADSHPAGPHPTGPHPTGPHPTAARPDATLRMRRIWGAALLVGLVAKLVLESAGDAFWLHAASFDVVTAAHRWGSAGGALYAIARGLTMRIRKRPGM